MNADERRIPVLVLTGFLGAGKTTLLNRLVQEPEYHATALIINELGSIGVDHHLVSVLDEHTVLLSAGCICCSVQGELVDTLQQLFLRAWRKDIPPFRQVIIETTGLADPAPVLFSLRHDAFLEERYRFAGTLTVVDARHGADLASMRPEAKSQIALADLLVISKTDLVDAALVQALQSELASAHPAAQQLLASETRAIAAALADLMPASAHPSAALRWLGPASASRQPRRLVTRSASAPVHSGVSTFAIRFDQPLQPARFWACMEGVRIFYGKQLLRFKGLLQLAGRSEPFVVHGVHDQLYPVTQLAEWPDGTPSSFLVFILDGVEHEELEQDLRNLLLSGQDEERADPANTMSEETHP